MNGFVAKRVWIAAAAVVATVSGASAGGNCDTYAKYTMQQAKENVSKRCNFKGPRWSLDAARHRAWCKEVGPVGWRAELKIRSKMLEDCKR
jgi:hypothetical protein